MKRSFLSKQYRKGHMLVVLLLVLGVYAYLSGFMDHATRPTRTVRKRIRVPVETPVVAESDNNGGGKDGALYMNVKLTYYEADPRYKISNFQHMEPQCFGEACELNRDRSEIQVVPLRRSHCVPISKCVTVNIKTRHRYQEVKEFINSFHEYYPALRVVVMDEFNPAFSESDFARVVEESPLITYIQARPGVGYGRKLAAMVSETPYVLVADDDYIFSARTNITKLVDVLENSDADIAAGTTDDTFPFAGAIRVSVEEGKTLLSLYPGIYYSVVPNYRNCYQADIVKTFFLAKRDAILSAGSWDASRPFYEHEDFFFQMRKGRLKIAYCDDVVVKHVARTRDLANLRSEYFDELKVRLLEKWKIDDYFSCLVPLTYFDQDTCEVSKRKHFK